MKSEILKFISIPIYVLYAYLFVWQIYYFNEEVFYNKELRDVKSHFFRYIPAIILLFYGLLLYINVLYGNRRQMILNSFLAASLISFYDTILTFSITIILMIFGLVITFLELGRTDKQLK
jgi:hypothetical protein